MAEYIRNDRPLTESQVNRLLERAVAEVGGTNADWRAFFGGEEPSHDENGQVNANAGEPRPGYLRLVSAAVGVTDQDVAAVVDGWNTMPLQSDKPSIVADGVEQATISLVYAGFDGDTVVDWELFLDGESISSGTLAVSGDTMTPETLDTDTPGTYEFEVRRQTGFESGIVTIIATEA